MMAAPREQLSDAGDDLVRLAAAKDAEIAALIEQRDGYKRDYEDTRDCLRNERRMFVEKLREQRKRDIEEMRGELDTAIADFRFREFDERPAALDTPSSPSLPESPIDG